jgi:hypothetical protein
MALVTRKERTEGNRILGIGLAVFITIYIIATIFFIIFE